MSTHSDWTSVRIASLLYYKDVPTLQTNNQTQARTLYRIKRIYPKKD